MSYWLLDWLDSEGIADANVIDGVLRTREGYERLLTAADQARGVLPDPPRVGKSLVAGTGLDLSGVLGCGRSECLERTVDDLVHRAWCYFDRIIVTGLDPNEFLERATSDRAVGRNTALNHSQAALYLRDIGAEEFFVFRRKAQLCVEHLNQHASEAGMPPVTEASKALASELAIGADIVLKESPVGLRYSFSHPLLSTTTSGVLKRRMKRHEVPTYLARRRAAELVSGLTRSVWLAREVHGALGQTALQSSRTLVVPKPTQATVADVAVSMRLPAIDGASARELLALRESDNSEFLIFRGALVKTIEERIKALPQDDAARVGQSVVEDILDPAIASLDLRLQRSTRLLGARSAAAVATGGVLTTVGLLSFAPLVIPGVVLAAGGMVANYADFLKDKREIDLSDLHFLWRADKQLHA